MRTSDRGPAASGAGTVASAAGVRKSRTTQMTPVRRAYARREPRLTGCGTIPIVRRARGEALKTRNGAVAQLGERRVRNAKVRGSIPLGSTKLGSSDQALSVVFGP